MAAPPGAQYDDYFERLDLGQPIRFGIDSLDTAVRSQIVALRDSGRIVHLYGTLHSNVPDVNGSQIEVDRTRGRQVEPIGDDRLMGQGFSLDWPTDAPRLGSLRGAAAYPSGPRQVPIVPRPTAHWRETVSIACTTASGTSN